MAQGSRPHQRQDASAYIRIFPEDREVVVFSPHNLTRGRIVYRYK